MALRAKTYKRLLNSILHTRFLQATAISYGYHLAVAGLSSDFYSGVWPFFWAFQPFSLAGIKALLFVLCSIFIHIEQIASFNAGQRCFPSNWEAIRYTLLSPSPYTTMFWYLASALWFSEVFIYTSPASKGLSWLISGGYDDLDQLNESPIYLRFLFGLLGFCQACRHIYNDYSSHRLRLDREGVVVDYAATTRAALSGQLSKRSYSIAVYSAILSGICTIIGPFIYTPFFRSSMWSIQVLWARALFANIPPSDENVPDGFYIGGVMFTGLWSGALLVSMWEFTTLIFEYYMMQEPTRNAQPLSSSSSDPNGTLLTGLKSKARIVQTFAFWEFNSICETNLDRRKAIFRDIDRPGQAPMSSQMIDAALAVVKAIETRIQDLNPAPKPKPKDPAQDPDVQRLPRILAQPVPGKNSIFNAANPAKPDTLGRIASSISQEVKKIGSSPTPWSPPIEETKRLAIEYTRPAVDGYHQRADAAQQSPIGRYFLTTPAALVKSTILGTPHANPALISFAIRSSTRLLMSSLAEDTYGKAIQSVPPTIQTFTQSIFAIRSFVAKHVGRSVSTSIAQQLDDIINIHDALKICLRDLLSSFGGFLSESGLPIHATNDARRASELGQLFTIEAAEPAAQTSQQQREMEDVSTQHQANQRERQDNEQRQRQQDTQRQERPKQKKESSRLFKQLDSAEYQKRRRKSIGENPLAAGSLRERNPFEARDYNTMPAGGLRRTQVR